jgi:hypothetical protein
LVITSIKRFIRTTTITRIVHVPVVRTVRRTGTIAFRRDPLARPSVSPGIGLMLRLGLTIFHWHSSYIQTYLERDVRSLSQVGDLTQFQSFLRALAARSAQLISISDPARDLGVAVNTIS